MSRPRPLILAACLLVALSVGVAVVALTPRSVPRADPTSAPTESSEAGVRALGQTATWGITVDPAVSAADQIADDEALVDRPVGVINAFLAWSLPPSVQTSLLDNLRSVSGTQEVMITWEPGERTDAAAPDAGSVGLAQIASGAADDELDTFLRQLDAFPGQVDLRFAHEMNGSWYSWAGEPALYLRAWMRVHDRIDQLAPRVRMVWSVNNVDSPSSNTLERYWPGRDAVDIIGIDGYNCLRGWESPAQVFTSAYSRVSVLDSTAPIWLTETSSCEAESSVSGSAGHSKAAWITQLLSSTAMPRVAAVVWFDRDKEYDWRTDSSAASVAALRRGLRG